MIRNNRSTGPRTSLSHPLQIAEVASAPEHGSIGITFCPGKKQRDAWTGLWDRDLCLDLDKVEAWGAALVVTLVEPHELEMLGVTQLGREVEARHMEWIHLPIRDVSVPDGRFEEAWALAGESIRARLRAGFNIVVHCKGGLGRAGTIAARLLVELGRDPTEAIAAVRMARPGAVETQAQVDHVMAQRSCPRLSLRDRQRP